MHSPELVIPPFAIRTTKSPSERPDGLGTARAAEKEKGGLTHEKPPRVYTNGIERLAILSKEAGFINNKLADLFTEACGMAKKGELDCEFIFFALHGDNIYKQPTDVRDYDVVQANSVPMHTSRPDYKIHGTILKMPLTAMMADEAVVCHICKGDAIIAAVASLSDYDYKEVFSLM